MENNTVAFFCASLDKRSSPLTTTKSWINRLTAKITCFGCRSVGASTSTWKLRWARKIIYKCIQQRRRSNVVEKFREVSITVWVSLKGMIWENTLKEEWTGKNDSNDNYNYYRWRLIKTLRSQFFNFERTISSSWSLCTHSTNSLNDTSPLSSASTEHWKMLANWSSSIWFGVNLASLRINEINSLTLIKPLLSLS